MNVSINKLCISGNIYIYSWLCFRNFCWFILSRMKRVGYMLGLSQVSLSLVLDTNLEQWNQKQQPLTGDGGPAEVFPSPVLFVHGFQCWNSLPAEQPLMPLSPFFLSGTAASIYYFYQPPKKARSSQSQRTIMQHVNSYSWVASLRPGHPSLFSSRRKREFSPSIRMTWWRRTQRGVSRYVAVHSQEPVTYLIEIKIHKRFKKSAF